MYKLYKIQQWEKAIEHRSDIRFEQINLNNGRVSSVIGTIQQPCKRKYRGQTHYRTRAVRWDGLGVCQNLYGTTKDDLSGYDINLA